MDIKYNTDTKIEDNARLYQLQKANFDQEVNTAVSIFHEIWMINIFNIVSATIIVTYLFFSDHL